MSALTEFRASKDAFFRDDPHSPLLPEQRATFAGLAYYDEQPALQLTLEAEPYEQQRSVEMQTSTGDVASYVRWARVRFAVDGDEVTLTVYRDDGAGDYFLPFVDANAGGETYGAGRYLDVHTLDDDRLLLDFNYAYNPYCAYNERWSCPIPPAENRLPVAVCAGEQSFEEHAS